MMKNIHSLIPCFFDSMYRILPATQYGEPEHGVYIWPFQYGYIRFGHRGKRIGESSCFSRSVKILLVFVRKFFILNPFSGASFFCNDVCYIYPYEERNREREERKTAWRHSFQQEAEGACQRWHGKERAGKERPVSFCLPGSGRPHGAEPFRLEGLFREAAAEQEGAFRQKKDVRLLWGVGHMVCQEG